MIPFFRRTISVSPSTVPDFLAPLAIESNFRGARCYSSTPSSPSESNGSSTSNSNFVRAEKERLGEPTASEKPVGPSKGQSRHELRSPGSQSSPNSSKQIKSTTFSKSSNKSSQPNAVRRKPLRNQSSPSIEGKARTDPFSVLTQIRSSAPSTISSSTSSLPKSSSTSNKDTRVHSPPFNSTDAHAISLALRSLESGLLPEVASFELAFVKGWKVLKSAGFAGRISKKQLPLLISIASIEISKSGKDNSERWKELKELIMWSAGETTMPGLPDWAWSTLVGGTDIGAERVAEVWESFMKGESIRLRIGEAALDRNSKPDFPSKINSAAERVGASVDSSLYAAYIVARSILHSSATFHQQFSLILPGFLDSAAPNLGRFLARVRPQLRVTLESTFAGTSAPITAILKAEAWLRQIHLANTWLRTGKGNGLGIILAINQGFKRNDPREAEKYWLAIKEGVESLEMGWIGDRWNATRGDHLLEGMSKGEALGDIPEEVISSSDDNLTSAQLKSPPINESLPLSPRPTQAYFTEALLAPFLVGFVRAKMYDRATEIWTWLENPRAPLAPGVVIWTALLRGYSANGDTAAAEAVFSQMQSAGIKPDSVTWINLVDGYFKAKNLTKAVELLQKMFTNKELRETLKDGKFEEEIYRKIIAGFLAAGKAEPAEAVLKDMLDEGVQPTIHSYNLFIRHYTLGSKVDFPSIVKTLRLISEQNLQADVFTFTMVLKGLLTVSKGDAVAKLISIMENSGVKPTVTTYGAIINSLSISGVASQLRAAIELVDEMEQAGMKTNEIIYTSIIQGFLKGMRNVSVELEEGEVVHPYLKAALALRSRMDSRKIPMNRIGYNAIIDAALYINSPVGNQLALSTFKELQSKISTRNSAGLDVGSDGEIGGKSVSTADTFYILLNGFAQNNDWSNARGVLRMMDDSKFVVKSNNLKKLVDKVVRGGWN